MAVAALALYAIWFAAAFAIRSIITRRRIGDSGFRGISGTPLSASWWAGVLFVVALVIGVAAPVVDLAGGARLVESAAVGLVGTILAIVGIVATLVAQRDMGTSWRVGVDHTERTPFVSIGAFAIVRNPIFTTMAITGVGLAAMVPNAVAVVGVVALFVALQLQVRVVEEPYLAGLHGDTYRTYAARVGRFLPGIGRYERARSGANE
jgi:protein-S-isoprenylcysteine O-methyltransferase Ste14